jgi:GTP-binding protein
MIDLVSLVIKAGNGGNGKVSFHREKYVLKGGPDGGHGGDGGNVVFRGSRHFNTLKHYAGKKEILAQSGGVGGRRKKSGAKGESTVMEVPLGTVVWLEAENEPSRRRRNKYDPQHVLTRGEVTHEIYEVAKEGNAPPFREPADLIPLSSKEKLIEITEEGQEIVLCQGGFGGHGNISFKSSVTTTPLIAEYGTFGEQKQIILELKLLADIGLVGYPNAGKSTLLSKITRAHPKTADYPFTTIEPNLGVLNLPEGRDLVVADIPGLIEGASEGKGLGHDFLRHIENCRMLLFVLFLEENVVSDTQLSNAQKAEKVWEQYQQLRKELERYQNDMLQKPSLISLNKTDIYPAELTQEIQARFTAEQLTLMPFSGFTGQGLPELVKHIERT